MRILILLTVFASLPLVSFAETEKRGYWWGEKLKTKAKINQPIPGPLPSEAAMMQMHPSELAKLLKSHREYAIWKKTPEAVFNYYKVQDVIRRNALAFTALTEYVLLKNPELNSRKDYPLNLPARKVSTQLRDKSIQNIFSNYKEQYALVVFTQQTCPYCVTQKNILKFVQDRYQWQIKEIDINVSAHLAARFNIKTTPVTILIERASQRWMPVAAGVASVPVIEDNVYRAIRLLQGKTNPKQFITTEHQQGGFFDPDIYREAHK